MKAAPRGVVEGPCGPAGAGAEPAAEDRRTGENSPGPGRQHGGSEVLQLLASLIIAGIIMAFGQAGSRGSEAIFERIIGNARGREWARLSTATIRAVALGVIGVALIQAIPIVGLALLVAGVPWAGVLAVIVLVLGIA